MEEKEFDYINVIPFIDIMLVLLTIVLTTSTFIAQGAIPMELPQVSSHQPGTIKSISIEIDQRSALYVNAKPVPWSGWAMKSGIQPGNARIDPRRQGNRPAGFRRGDGRDQEPGFKKLSLQTEVKK